MSLSTGVSGAWKTVDSVSVGVSGAWKTVQTGYVGVSGVWKEFYSALRVNLTNQTANSFTLSPGTAEAAYILNSNGNAQLLQDGNTTNVSGEWLVFGTNSAFEVRATLNSGSLSSGTTGTWLSLGTTRTWTVQETAGTKTANLTIEIRRASDGTVLDSCTVDITAEVSP